MKKFDYFYRKRGLPQSAEHQGTLDADGFYDANSKAAKEVGEEYVITRVVQRKENNNESVRLSEEDKQSDS